MEITNTTTLSNADRIAELKAEIAALEEEINKKQSEIADLAAQ